MEEATDRHSSTVIMLRDIMGKASSHQSNSCNNNTILNTSHTMAKNGVATNRVSCGCNE